MRTILTILILLVASVAQAQYGYNYGYGYDYSHVYDYGIVPYYQPIVYQQPISYPPIYIYTPPNPLTVARADRIYFDMARERREFWEARAIGKQPPKTARQIMAMTPEEFEAWDALR